tara:strand:- start:857 stop:1528 length:672 start_codon:yes stop_codon:yes gene_type:complete
MGYILPEIYQSAVQQTNKSMPKIFIETGTFKGGVPHLIMERYNELDSQFNHYYTIELSEDLCKIASKRYKSFEQYNYKPPYDIRHSDDMDTSFSKQCTYCNNRLTLINGDSAVELKKLLETINEPICFWLDAHSGAQQYARGIEDVPLLAELDLIKNHHIKDHIIAIDDAHLFGKIQYNSEGDVSCDYSNVTFERVREKLLEINPNFDVGVYAPYQMQMVIAV